MTAIPSPLVFTYQDGEFQRFRREAARSRGSVAYGLWLIALPMIVVIGVAVLAAQKAELIEPTEVPSVLIAAYLAYACGVGLVVLVGRMLRWMQPLRATRARDLRCEMGYWLFGSIREVNREERVDGRVESRSDG